MIERFKFGVITLYLPLMALAIIPLLLVVISLLTGCAAIDAWRNVDR